MSSARTSIVQECDECRGTGLYVGMCEAEGEAVVCLRCDGRGWTQHQYVQYTHRKRRKGVKTIRVSAGRCIGIGVGGRGQSMTYAEFQKKYPTIRVVGR